MWPHENSLIAAGLARYGHHEQAATIAAAMLSAAPHFEHRLPEVFAGYPAAVTSVPVAYPTASRPQAWAAGTPLQLLTTLLDLQPGFTHTSRELPHGPWPHHTATERKIGNDMDTPPADHTDAIGVLVKRLARPHPSGGTVIERSVILAEGKTLDGDPRVDRRPRRRPRLYAPQPPQNRGVHSPSPAAGRRTPGRSGATLHPARARVQLTRRGAAHPPAHDVDAFRLGRNGWPRVAFARPRDLPEHRTLRFAGIFLISTNQLKKVRRTYELCEKRERGHAWGAVMWAVRLKKLAAHDQSLLGRV